MQKHLIHVVEIDTPQKGRVFTPPGAGAKLKAKIKARMGNPTRGCEKIFAEATGLSYGIIRQWVHEPIIPFLLAEFVAFWLEMSLDEMMDLVGVRITPQMRKNSTILKAPSLEILQNQRFQLIATLLQKDGYTVIHQTKKGEKTCVPEATLPGTKDALMVYQELKQQAREIAAKYLVADLDASS